MESEIDLLTNKVVAAVDGYVATHCARYVRQLGAQREGEFLALLQAMELRIATLERQAVSHKDHLGRLQKRLRVEHPA